MSTLLALLASSLAGDKSIPMPCDHCTSSALVATQPSSVLAQGETEQYAPVDTPQDDGPKASVPADPSPIKIEIEPVLPVRSIGGLVSTYPGIAHVDVYGVTDTGTNLTAIRLGSEDQDRPCIVVVADPLAPRDAGRDAVLQLASQLLDRMESDQDGDLLCRVDWWLVPDPNPDREGEANRTARIGSGFLAGWTPWGSERDPGPWPLFDSESHHLANALAEVPGASAALVLTEQIEPFAGGHLVRHCREHLSWLTMTARLDGTRDLEQIEALAAGLPALNLTAPLATDLGEGLWLIEHDLYATGCVSDSAPPVDLSWTGASVVALAHSVTKREPEREAEQVDAVYDVVRHRAERTRLDGPLLGSVQRLRWVLRIPQGSAPTLIADGTRWSSARRSVILTAR